MAEKVCLNCKGGIPDGGRPDRKYCSEVCRKAHFWRREPRWKTLVAMGEGEFQEAMVRLLEARKAARKELNS